MWLWIEIANTVLIDDAAVDLLLCLCRFCMMVRRDHAHDSLTPDGPLERLCSSESSFCPFRCEASMTPVSLMKTTRD